MNNFFKLNKSIIYIYAAAFLTLFSYKSLAETEKNDFKKENIFQYYLMATLQE